jgi:3-phenylpropionate/trans-cinnamate dioxygenase ferredoxin reductase component
VWTLLLSRFIWRLATLSGWMVAPPDWYRAHQIQLDIGHARKWDRLVIRGSLAERKFVGFYLQAGKLWAAVGLNCGGDSELDKNGELAKAGRLIAKGARPAVRLLADEDVEIEPL